MQSATNTSTAADLLKQGAGTAWAFFVIGDFPAKLTSTKEPSE